MLVTLIAYQVWAPPSHGKAVQTYEARPSVYGKTRPRILAYCVHRGEYAPGTCRAWPFDRRHLPAISEAAAVVQNGRTQRRALEPGLHIQVSEQLGEVPGGNQLRVHIENTGGVLAGSASS